jgi:ribonuclease P protein component
MVMNTGERLTTKHFVIFYKRDATLGASRFGFVVSKMVGGAVLRNAVKRKLRAQSQILLNVSADSPNFWLVARALPAASTVDSHTVSSELQTAFAKLSARQAQ